MSYHISKTVSGDFEDVVEKVIAALTNEGFGVLTQIDVKATLKKKLDVDFRPYVILGACNPGYAYQALQAEDKVGTMLPCNVIVQVQAEERIEISAVDPAASMLAIENPKLETLAGEIRSRLVRVVESVS